MIVAALQIVACARIMQRANFIGNEADKRSPAETGVGLVSDKSVYNRPFMVLDLDDSLDNDQLASNQDATNWFSDFYDLENWVNQNFEKMKFQ